MVEPDTGRGTDAIAEYDRIPVRALAWGDLDAMVAIDQHAMGRSRRDYLEVKLGEALRSGDT